MNKKLKLKRDAILSAKLKVFLTSGVLSRRFQNINQI